MSPSQPSCPDLLPSSGHPVCPVWVMHRSQPWPCQESSNKQERRHKHRAGLEGSPGFSASPPELCLNPTKKLQDQPNHPEAMELQTQQFKLQQETQFLKPAHAGMSTLQPGACRSQAGDLSGSISIFTQIPVGPQSLLPACPVRGQCPVCISLPLSVATASQGLARTNPAAWQSSGTHRGRAGGETPLGGNCSCSAPFHGSLHG